MNTILLIDDEVQPMKYYVLALQNAGYRVIQIKGPDEAMTYMTEHSDSYPDLIILDIMMPPGVRYAGRPDAERGLRTGILLYEDLRKVWIKTPVVILTNSGQGKEEFAMTYKGICVLAKFDTPPFMLVEVIKSELCRKL